jgi:hypothetical protein
MGSETSIDISMHTPKALSSPFPSSFFARLSPIVWRLAARGGMEQAAADIRGADREGERQIRWRRGGTDLEGRPAGGGGLAGRGWLQIF